MKYINSFPLEDFLEKIRIAAKTNQKSLTLTQKEYTDLGYSLSIVLARLVGNLDKPATSVQETIKVKMDGGKF